MTATSHMPRYDVRNDGSGPYAVFYCDACSREFRSQPDMINTVSQDIGRQALGGLLRKVPILGSSAADNLMGEDPRYSYKLTPAQLEKAWAQASVHFRECPTCGRVVCLSDFDTQSGFCQEDSPRTDEIAEARGSQAGAALKGFASAFGLGEVIKKAEEAAQQVQAAAPKCSQCGLPAAPGVKFCPECGGKMIQPAADACPQCGAQTYGAKFCPECGVKIERAPQPAACPQCGAQTNGAKFCPECGAKQNG